MFIFLYNSVICINFNEILGKYEVSNNYQMLVSIYFYQYKYTFIHYTFLYLYLIYGIHVIYVIHIYICYAYINRSASFENSEHILRSFKLYNLLLIIA